MKKIIASSSDTKHYTSLVSVEKKVNKSGKVEIAAVSVERTTVKPPCDNRCYADSGATTHVCHSLSVFVPGSITSCEPRTIKLADNSSVTATQSGDVLIPFEHVNLRLSDVLLVPGLGYNLVSVGQMCDKGVNSSFDSGHVHLSRASDGMEIGSGHRDRQSGLYVLPQPEEAAPISGTALVLSTASETELWHRRLAHVNFRDLSDVHKHTTDVPQLQPSSDVCRACRLGKAHKLPFTSHFATSSSVGDILHSDIIGPLPLSFPDGHRYAASFLDDHSRFLFFGMMQCKSDIADVYTGVCNQLGNAGFNVGRVHSDCAKEYVSLQDAFRGEGVEKTFSPPYTPEHNGIAERVNRTVIEASRSLLIQANLPSSLWPFALKHVVYVRNRIPHSAIKSTAFEVVHGTKPSLKDIRVFGCSAYVLRLPRGSKFEPRAVEGVLLECLPHGIYRVLVIQDSSANIIESRHVTFDENRFPGAPDLEHCMSDEADSDSDVSSDTVSDVGISFDDGTQDARNPPVTDQDSSSHKSIGKDSFTSDEDEWDDAASNDDDARGDGATEPTQNNDTLGDGDGSQRRYPVRERKRPQAWFMLTSAQRDGAIEVTTSDEPTLREAMNATPSECDLWKQAIDDEFKSLKSKCTWTRDDSPGAQPLPTHIVLKVKRNSDGTVDRFKARIVAGGNFQTYGTDYMETYAPVVSFSLVRTFLYIAIMLQLYVAQLDVKTAFLNGDLDEDVWVMSPRGVPGVRCESYRLLKALYGLKQAHLAWHKRLYSDLETLGFTELPSAPCVFVRALSPGKCFVLVYVDDLIVMSTSERELGTVVNCLKELYEVRVSDNADFFLGVQLEWKRGTDGQSQLLRLSQPLYTRSVLRRFGMCGSRPAITPMVESFFTGLASEEDKSAVSAELYQQMIGSLLYLALRTRPDILAPVLILARFQKAPTAYCHRGVKRVLRYLNGTTDLVICYSASGLAMIAHVDSDYAGDTMDRKSMSGYLVKIGGAMVIWGAKKQNAVSLSTCEAEYHAMPLAATELVWLKRVLCEAGVVDSTSPIVIKSDNQSAIAWATGERCASGRAKHIDVRIHYIRDLVQQRVLEVEYIASGDNDADMLTKPLGRIALRNVCGRIGLGSTAAEEC